MQSEVAYGNTLLSFSIDRLNRKSLAIEVHPDLSIKVIAPVEADLNDIKEKVLKKAKWITKQRVFFEQFLPRTPEREYVSGESHFYLGRKYILKTRTSDQNKVKLKGGELLVYSQDKEDKSLTKRLLSEWYYKHAKKRFNQCITESLSKFSQHDIPKDPPLVVKRMNKRWGSCTSKGRIIINPEIIKTPMKCVEYVIIHELCHLIHPNHNKKFYDLQKEMMPDWEKWKLKLEKILV